MIEPEIKPKENRIDEIDIIFKDCNIDYEILANELIREINNKYNKINASGANEKIEINKEIKHIYLQYHNVKFFNNINGFIDIIEDNNNTRLSLVFKDCIFDTKINLEKINFNADIVYYDCIFNENIYFFGSKFNKDTNFVRCTFKKEADFKCTYFSHARFFDSTFDGDALFEEASFDRSDFSRVTFHKLIDFTGSIIDKSKTSFMNCSTDYTIDDMRKLAADKIDSLRESYCIIKSILISEHNILEAANWHKLELYAKEIELEYKKPKSFTREWIDKWQLLFYRITSNHHTDLLKSFHSLLVVIGIFAFLNIAIIIGFNCYCLQNVSLYPCALIAHYNAIIKHLLNCNYISLLIINLVLVVVFILLFCFTFCNKLRKIIIFLSYFLVLFLLISLPRYIIPTISIFTDKRPFFDPLSIIGGIYTILFATMFFSFIKTARKNSIVPN